MLRKIKNRKWLSQYCLKHNTSIEALAVLCGVSSPRLYELDRGQKLNISFQLGQKILMGTKSLGDPLHFSNSPEGVFTLNNIPFTEFLSAGELESKNY
jgi:hypothetical protein